MYVSVVIKNKSVNTDRFFTYRCDFEHIKIGDKVIVPFGKGNKEKEGYVVGILSDKERENYLFNLDNSLQNDENMVIKPIISVSREESISEEAMKTALWMREEYFAKFIDCINLFSSGDRPKTDRKKQRELLTGYEDKGNDVQRLTFEQEFAIKEIAESIEKRENKIFLLQGVTGSGKTEVYLQTVKKTLEEGKTSIVMVPEITLTKQLIDRFIYRFGRKNIAIIHSKLSKREQYEQWQEIKSGKKNIVIGARSACFAPLENIGVIILDEEHDMSYKAQMMPRFDARQVGIKRGELNDAVVVLGSATPSVESMVNANSGKYKKLVMKNRYNFVELPKVAIVDMREELKKGNMSIFSRKLYDEILRALESDRQVMLMVNKKGYSTFVSCRNCGHVIKCSKCNVPMGYSKKDNKLRCGYCGESRFMDSICPECGSRFIKHFGIGTETVEEQVNKFFPKARTKILDLDHAKKIDDIKKTISEFETGEIEVLIGTQIITKGLDFKNVGLVGIVAADTWLNSLDYRGRERCFQNIVHSSGRSGRGDERGKVVLQTYQPDDFAIIAGAMQNVEMFFEEENRIRKVFNYPPYSKLCEVVLSNTNAKVLTDTWREFEKIICVSLGKNSIIGKRKVVSHNLKKEKAKMTVDKNESLDEENKKIHRKYKIIALLKLDERESKLLFEIGKKFRDGIRERREKTSVLIDANPGNLWRM